MAKYFDRGSPLDRSDPNQGPVRKVDRNRSINPNIFDPNPQAQRSSMQGGLIPIGLPQKKHKVPFAERYGASPTPTQTVTVSNTRGTTPTSTVTKTRTPTQTRTKTQTQTVSQTITNTASQTPTKSTTQ